MTEQPPGGWSFVKVGLIVTGETEELCLPDLFGILASQGTCSFRVIRRVGQRSPIRSERHADFDEKEHGPPIVRNLNVVHVLSRADACRSLRTMFAWAAEATHSALTLPEGQWFAITEPQIDALRGLLQLAPPARQARTTFGDRQQRRIKTDIIAARSPTG